MFDTIGTYSFYGMESYPIVKPNIRTGEGRMKGRGWPKQKSISRKKWKNTKAMSKHSRQKNRR